MVTPPGQGLGARGCRVFLHIFRSGGALGEVARGEQEVLGQRLDEVVRVHYKAHKICMACRFACQLTLPDGGAWLGGV